jgi:hypothetical protein
MSKKGRIHLRKESRAEVRQQTADSEQQTADSRQQTTDTKHAENKNASDQC